VINIDLYEDKFVQCKSGKEKKKKRKKNKETNTLKGKLKLNYFTFDHKSAYLCRDRRSGPRNS
jgi:hypothetical protein